MPNHIKVKEVRVDATPGASIEQAIQDAVILAIREDRTIRLRWYRREIMVSLERIVELLKREDPEDESAGVLR